MLYRRQMFYPQTRWRRVTWCAREVASVLYYLINAIFIHQHIIMMSVKMLSLRAIFII